MESSMTVSQKTKIKLPYDPKIPFKVIDLTKTEHTNLKRYMHPIFIAVLITVAKI